MPLLKEKEFENNSRLCVWEISETVEDLYQPLTRNALEHEFSRLKTEKRRKEFLAARNALNTLSPNFKLKKDENGRPFFSDSNKHLSISHADGWAAAIVGEEPLGIDIENYREKIIRVAPKFMSNTDMEFLMALGEVEAYTLLWSIKESVFKRFSNFHLDFKHEMELAVPVFNQAGSLKVNLNKKDLPTQIEVHYELNEGYVLTWTV
jgi:4'-phosphopantetheinyl transferase EntD